MKKKLPIPERRKYPFAELENRGDYVEVFAPRSELTQRAAHNYARYNGFLVVTEKIEGGLRVFHAGERSK